MRGGLRQGTGIGCSAGVLRCYVSPMSDKTKFYADQELIRRRMAEQRAREAARGDTTRPCQCGKTAYETTVWAVQDGRQTMYYCAACAPDDVRETVAVNSPMSKTTRPPKGP